MKVFLLSGQATLLRSLAHELRARGVLVATGDLTGPAQHLATDAACDVLVLDVAAPADQGLALLRSWRGRGLNSHLLVLLPSRLSVKDRVRWLEQGADDFVTKPYDLEELLARLRALARRAWHATEPIRRVHDLEIDPSRRQVRRGDRDIHLTPREFKLLLLLADHQGKTVSRTMILEHLYERFTPARSNVVEVYIRYLRKKIDYALGPPLILTRWGQGYALRGENGAE